MADDGSIRIGDEERRAVDARLQRAHGEGRLSLEEYEERSARAWAARTRGDLTELTVDLPADGAVARAGHTGEVAAPTPAREVVTEFARRAGSASGWKVFGSTDCPTACTGTGTREIVVEVSGAFGSTEILTRTEAAAEPRDADDDD